VEAHATRRVLLENRKLVTKREDLRLQGRTRSKTGGYQSEKGDEKRAHRGSHHDLTNDRNLFVFRSDGVFGSKGAAGSHLALIQASGGKIVPFLATKANETSGQISPDGKWVAYASNESGDWEIYVTTFPTAAGKWQVSRGGGTEPRWRGDGKEIFYIGARGTLTAVPVNSARTFSSGNPTPLFQSQLRAQISSTDIFNYDTTRDGQRFLVNRYAKPQQVAPLHVVLDATAELRK
jgi:Tol biopolymer transport system component